MFSKKGDLNSLRIVDFGLATLKTAERFPFYIDLDIFSLNVEPQAMLLLKF